MATSKKTSKKPPAPPKNKRMDIILDPKRLAILDQLQKTTGIKTQTGILFHCASFVFDDVPGLNKSISDLREENRLLKAYLLDLKNEISESIRAVNILKAFDQKHNLIDNQNPLDYLPNSVTCPECEYGKAFLDPSDKFYRCDHCDFEFKPGL